MSISQSSTTGDAGRTGGPCECGPGQSEAHRTMGEADQLELRAVGYQCKPMRRTERCKAHQDDSSIVCPDGHELHEILQSKWKFLLMMRSKAKSFFDDILLVQRTMPVHTRPCKPTHAGVQSTTAPDGHRFLQPGLVLGQGPS
eukprot:1153994-Pelagomonas_calceolata.AAC.8